MRVVAAEERVTKLESALAALHGVEGARPTLANSCYGQFYFGQFKNTENCNHNS